MEHLRVTWYGAFVYHYKRRMVRWTSYTDLVGVTILHLAVFPALHLGCGRAGEAGELATVGLAAWVVLGWIHPQHTHNHGIKSCHAYGSRQTFSWLDVRRTGVSVAATPHPPPPTTTCIRTALYAPPCHQAHISTHPAILIN